MATWVLRCKLYPGATPWRNIRFARPFRGGGLILPAMAGLDRWLSRQNPAYRPVLQKSTAKSGAQKRLILRMANAIRRILSYLVIYLSPTELAELFFISSQVFSTMGTLIVEPVRNDTGNHDSSADITQRFIHSCQQDCDKPGDYQAISELSCLVNCHFGYLSLCCYSSFSSVGCTGASPATSDTGRLKAMPLAFLAIPISL